MTKPGLNGRELRLIASVLRRYPEVKTAKVFGSRAKGTHTDGSDVDVAVWGELDHLRAESIAAALDELPLPYRFEVKAFERIQLPALREHIERVGIIIYTGLQKL